MKPAIAAKPFSISILNIKTLTKFIPHRFVVHCSVFFVNVGVLANINYATIIAGADACNGKFGEGNPLSIEIYSREVAEQKLRYIHNNPYKEKWNLATNNVMYKYSSEEFYNTNYDEMNILTHYLDYFEK